MAKIFDETEATLRAFHDAHQRRMALLQDGANDAVHEVIERERNAIFRHAAAIRAQAERLAKLGR